MKFSYNWIGEMVQGLETSPQDLMRLITMKTAECECVEPVGEHLDSVAAARVVSVEAIPGRHNSKAVVETERYGTRTVVCGAPNCQPGMPTAYVPLAPKLIDGVESDGMLASGADLGGHGDHNRVC